MICSLWKISFTITTGPRAGEEIVLLDHGDWMEDEPVLPIAQSAATSVPIFSPFGHAFALGGALTSASWTRRRSLPGQHPRTQAMLDAYFFPWGQQGTITVAILDSATFAFDHSTIESIEPSYPLDPAEPLLLQSYTASCGVMRLVAGPIPVSPARWELLVTAVCPNLNSVTTVWGSITTTPVT